MTLSTARHFRRGAVALLMLTSSTMAAAIAINVDAWTVYRELVTECETATSMAALLPFLPQWRHERYQAADETSRKEALERICKATRDLEDMALVRQEATDGGTIIHLTASWNGLPMKGKVTLLLEGEALKVEEWTWATGE